VTGYWISIGLAAAEVLGVLSAVHALMSVRTPQATVAWVVSLLTLPVVSVPAYWVFGRNRFKGYVMQRETADDSLRAKTARRAPAAAPFFAPLPTERGWAKLTTDKWRAGLTIVVMNQKGPWTFGGLANHIWSIVGDGDRTDVSSTFLQPFVSYTTPEAWTCALVQDELRLNSLEAAVEPVTRVFGKGRVDASAGGMF
jgi:hypothetical protein